MKLLVHLLGIICIVVVVNILGNKTEDVGYLVIIYISQAWLGIMQTICFLEWSKR